MRSVTGAKPLQVHLAHGRVLNMHRAQGMTYDRTISVIDSHDRLLNSASLFYVLNSRAREDSAIHLDDKDAVARSVEDHRGATPNAMDLARELSGQSAEMSAGKTGVDALLDKASGTARESISGINRGAEPDSMRSGASVSLPEKQMPEPAPTKSHDFDMER